MDSSEGVTRRKNEREGLNAGGANSLDLSLALLL